MVLRVRLESMLLVTAILFPTSARKVDLPMLTCPFTSFINCPRTSSFPRFSFCRFWRN